MYVCLQRTLFTYEMIMLRKIVAELSWLLVASSSYLIYRVFVKNRKRK